MEDPLIDSDSGSFDSFTYIPAITSLTGEGRLATKRSFENLVATAAPSSPSSNSTTAGRKREGRTKDRGDPKKRKVSFLLDEPEQKNKEGAGSKQSMDLLLSVEEIEEMKRKSEHWWNLPAITSQEEYDNAFQNFKDGRYFQIHMDVEWLDVQIQRACGRVLSQDPFSAAAQDLGAALHGAITRNEREQVEMLAKGDAELLQLIAQYKEASSLMKQERQQLTDKFGIIHSAKIAIKSEVYVCSATRLKQAGKEVTDEAVEVELAAFERGEVTVPGSQQQGGCMMAHGYKGGYPSPTSASASQGSCPVRHEDEPTSDPSRPSDHRPATASVCPFTGHKAPTRGDNGLQAREEEAVPAPEVRPATGVCPITGHKAPTRGDKGLQAREEDEDEEPKQASE